MVHAVFLVLGLFLLLLGLAFCGLLVYASIKAGRTIWLVTFPGVLIISLLALDVACRLFHLPRHVIPHQIQIVGGIRQALEVAAIPLLLARLYELWAKRRARTTRSKHD